MDRHFVLGTPLDEFPEGTEEIVFGMGCFWGAEKLFWSLEGVFSTAVGYSGGHAACPTYRDVCSGGTGHAEVVRVRYNPTLVARDSLLKTFWEGHDPTQGMRQGPDIGTQYRSAIYVSNEHDLAAAEHSRDVYQKVLTSQGLGEITTQIAKLDVFHFAEAYHQQYLAKNPHGYCGHGGTGVTCPIGVSPLKR